MYVFYNVNPDKKRTTDCVIRAVSLALDQDWDTTFIHVAVECLKQHDMPDMRYSRRGRNSLGQYASRHDGMDETVKHMVHKLEDLRMDAPDELTRKTIDEAISKLEMY